ncbi:MAG: MFS transporter [Thermoleophilia bacterium]|nr:MFS transporter [Thermoleophilia bacterium]
MTTDDECGTTRPPTVAPHSISYLFPITFCSGIVLISLGPLLDPIIRDLEVPLSQGGIIAAGFAAGRVVALLVLNLFLARLSLRRLVVGAALLQAVGFAIPALLADGLGLVVAGLAVVGAAATIPIVVPVIWIGFYAKQATERAMLLILIFFALGVVVSPLAIGGALALGADWRWVFLGEAAFSVVMATVITLLPLADVPGRANIRLRHVREAAGWAPGLLAVMLTAMFMYIGAEHILNIWLAEYQVQTFGAGQGAAAVALALFFGGMMVGRLASVRLTRRFAASRILAVSSAFMAVFIVVTAFAPSFAASEVCISLTGLGASASYPMLSSYVNRFPAKYAGLLFSTVTLVVIVSGAVFAYAAGPVAEALGMRTSIALAAVPAAIVVVLSFFLPGTPLDIPGEASDA